MTTPHTPTPAERAEELAFQMSVYADNDMHIPLPLFREWEAAVEAADTLDQLQANLADARNEGDWTGAKFIELDLLAFCEKHGIDLNAPVEDDEEEEEEKEEEAPAPAPTPTPPHPHTPMSDTTTTPHTLAERAAISTHEQLHATIKEWFATREKFFALETRLGELGDRIDALENMLEDTAPAPLKFSVPPRLYTGRLDDPGIGEFTLSDGYSDQVVGFIGTYQAALAAHPGYYPYLRQVPTE